MLRNTVMLAALGYAAIAVPTPASAATEAARVAREACGDAPAADCLAELRKVCHPRLTFRCYYSQKNRLDAVREVGFPDEIPLGADDGQNPLDE